MLRRPPSTTPPVTLFPYPTLFRGRRLRVVVVLERRRRVALEVDGARLTGGHLLAVVSDDVDGADDGLADGAGVGQPVLAVAVDEAVALRACVVLEIGRAHV